MDVGEREQSLERELNFLREDYAEIQGQMVEMQAAAHELIGIQAKIDSLLNGVSEGIIILRPDQTVQTFNHKAELIFGYRQEGLLGKTIESLFALPDGFEGRITDFLTTYCNDTDDMLEHPLWGRHKDGSEVPLRASVSQVASNDMVLFDDEFDMQEDEAPTFDLFICLLHDLSGELRTHRLLEQQRESLMLANQAKDEFLSRVSHELRTPLNGILPIAELLQEAGLAEDLRVFVDTIVEAGRDLAGIINEILDFSSVERQGASVTLAPMALAELFDDLAAVHAGSAAAKGLALRFDLDPALPRWINCDRDALYRILNTLLENAIKFTHSGSVQAEACLIAEESKFRLRVADTGIGIAEDALAGLFSSFSQQSRYLTREYGGTGLGLALAMRYANALESQIEVRSVLGVGAEFWLDLRLDAVDASAESLRPSSVNEAMLDDLAEAMGESLPELLQTYLLDSRANLDRIVELHQRGGGDALARVLASLKEASHSVGAVHLAELCGRDDPVDDDTLEKMRGELARVEAHLDKYLARVEP
ncbi:MAG: PAS domain S-box protein [Chromatiales bacterium]|nr:PAS domain S-box protein [Chromatiales bacterium]